MTEEQLIIMIASLEELQVHFEERVTMLQKLADGAADYSARRFYETRADIYEAQTMVNIVQIGAYRAMLERMKTRH